MSARRALLWAIVAVAAAAAGCERETRHYQELPAGATRAEGVRQSALQAGEPQPMAAEPGPYHENAWGISEGKRLYSAYNCVGCHAYGGGGIGPALMDDKWIYGATPQQIYSTIVEGRTNGMPAFGGRVPDQQVWQLVAYVQSMSGQTPQDANAGRDDNLAVKEPEVRKERERPKQTGHR